MRGLYCIIIVVLFPTLSYSQKQNNFIGKWKLTSWSVGLEMDLNKDGKFNSNFIEETICNNNEVLIINAEGKLTSKNTFNPTVNISKTQSKYKISEKCNNGSIGFSNMFSIEGNDIKLDIGGKYQLTDGKLTRVFQGAANVFTPDYSEVIETRDLVLTYSKM